MMKISIKHWVLATILICGASVFTACSSNDDNPAPIDISSMEQSLVGLWWDEYEYADVTETGVPFSRVLLAVVANADHTGCIYLGVFDDKSDEPLAIYGGPEDAGFTWRLQADGTLLLGDPATGKTYALARTRGADGGSYGEGATDVSNTSLTYTGGSVTMTNGSYSGTLAKADAETAANITKTLSTPTLADALVKGAKVVITYKWNNNTTVFTFINNGGTFSCDINGPDTEYVRASLTSEGGILFFSAKDWTASDFDLEIKFNVANNSYKFWTITHDTYQSHTISVNGVDITDKLTRERD